MFDDGVEGFYWELKNPGGAAELLIRGLEDRALYEQMAAAASTRYEEHFALDSLGSKWRVAVLGLDQRCFPLLKDHNR